MRRLAVVTALTAAALLLGGCTGDTPSATPGDGSSDRPSAASSSATTPSPAAPTTTPAAVPPAPRSGACYQLGSAELTRPTNASRPVSCARRHNARTVYVGRLVTSVDGHAVAVDSQAVQEQLSTTCPRKLAAYVGGSATARDLSRFHVVWFSPTLAQSDAGADWFRCDLIAFATESSLLPLPRKTTLRNVLDRSSALDDYGLCGTAAPGAAGFSRVICGRQHSWRAIETISIAGGKAYPGTSTVRRAGDSACKDEARSRASDTLKFQYGWEWPSRAQWKGGQHFGYCWVPA